MSANRISNGAAVAVQLPCEEPLHTAVTIASDRSDIVDEREAHHRALEVAIYQRIQSRLPGRVRNLVVRSFESLVIIEGQCATYYTKQLAQHAAMGVLEDEHLENAIAVMIE